MGTPPASDRALADGEGRAGVVLIALTVAAWMTALGIRLWAGQDLPLWIDETWTAMIASQPDWQSFWREAWLDVNPPLYYALMALWIQAAGLSDLALRLPSFAFVFLAGALPLLWRPAGLTRNAACCLSAMIILWRPGIDISLDARGYGLLLLLSVAQMFAFARLMQSPGRGLAALWAAFASAAILTHYFAIIPAAVQGLSLLLKERQRALRLWPAALLFVPAFGWLIHHLPRLADYARPEVVWYEPVTPSLAAGFSQYLVGPPGWLQWGLIAAALTLAAAASRGRVMKSDPATRALQWAAAAGVAALGLLFVIGVLRATLTDRYLVPVIPSLLLGLTLMVQRLAKPSLGQALLILVFLVPMGSPNDIRQWLVTRTFYGFEHASEYLLPHRPNRLTFVWDHPAARILDGGSLAKLGGFFFARAGQAVPTQSLVLKAGDDGNEVLQSAASGGAVIWIYNRARATAARTHPPDAARWTRWSCQHERGPWVGILTCVQVAKQTARAKVAP